MSKQYYENWKLLSAKIKALASLVHLVDENNGGGRKSLKDSIEKCRGSIDTFKTNLNGELLPHEKECNDLLTEFLSYILFDPLRPNAGSQVEQIRTALTKLSVLEAEISYLLNNTQSYIRKTVEIAFAHLQRHIMADETVRTTWKKAFKKGEIHCEKLGGVHLLLHKIWAFKADDSAGGGRTDLVLQEAINKEHHLYQSVDGLVLTEWKVVKFEDKNKEETKEKIIKQIIGTAETQALKYKEGSLFPMELSKYYYLVMVSEKSLKIPKAEYNSSDGTCTFRVINIAVDPDNPSVEAKKENKRMKHSQK